MSGSCGRYLPSLELLQGLAMDKATENRPKPKRKPDRLPVISIFRCEMAVIYPPPISFQGGYPCLYIYLGPILTYETREGVYVPKNRPKRMQQGGEICPQILRIWHEYHIKALKIVKKKSTCDREKILTTKKPIHMPCHMSKKMSW